MFTFLGSFAPKEQTYKLVSVKLPKYVYNELQFITDQHEETGNTWDLYLVEDDGRGFEGHQ